MPKIQFDDGTELDVLPVDWVYLMREFGALRRYSDNNTTTFLDMLKWFGTKEAFEHIYVKNFPSKQFRYQIDQKVEGLLKE